jgi:seryl-tRNA synthetase
MLDIRLIREEPERVRAALERRGGEYSIDEVLSLDARRRKLQTDLDNMRAEQKEVSKQVGKAAKEERDSILARAKAMSEEVKALEGEESAVAAELHELMLRIPNLPHESAPDGASDDDNVELRRWGLPPAFDFDVRDHLEIGTALDIIDMERAARTSGSRFAYLKREAAILEMSLMRFALDQLVAKGFIPVVPPVLVRRGAMEATGFLPTDEAQIYKTADDDLYLVGTSEVALASLHMSEFLDAADLPLRYAGYSTCFRREAGTYGKDTRGIFRVHQFNKVEMFSFTTPEKSWEEHEFLISVEEEILQALNIPYRAVNVAAGELGPSAAKKVDLEGWLPGQAQYRELTSCSNATDYQARRLGTRIRTEDGAVQVHTLNGTAMTDRFLIAIMENNQRADGGVHIPHVLVPYTGFELLGPVQPMETVEHPPHGRPY